MSGMHPSSSNRRYRDAEAGAKHVLTKWFRFLCRPTNVPCSNLCHLT